MNTDDDSRLHLIPASAFSYEELTEAYNKTRVDYIVPMPMNANKLRQYVETYDVDMDASLVAVDGNEILGLAMLGVRDDHAWITRLGVIRSNRRNRTGTALMDNLIRHAENRGCRYIVLEVILDNIPAHKLFVKKGFEEVRELLVLRRPPTDPTIDVPPATFEELTYPDIKCLLELRKSKPSWLDEAASLINAGNLHAFRATLEDGSKGWLIYQSSMFQLSRLVIQTERGDPVTVGKVLLHHLHTKHPIQDTKTENLPANDPHWPAFKAMGYIVSFRRIEMIRKLENG